MKEEKRQSFTITCNKESHICHVGDIVEFKIEAPVPDVEAEVLFTADGEAELARFRIKTPCVLKQTLPFPGFLRCKVSAPNMETALAGVAFDPESIRPALPIPDDFQIFWKNALEKQEAIAPDFQMQEIDEYVDSENTYYEISCNTVNNAKCYGYLRLPKGKTPVPLLVYYEGAGAGMSREYFAVHCKTCDAHLPNNIALLVVFAHNYHPGKTHEEHLAIHRQYLKSLGSESYWIEGLERGREYTFFYRSLLGAVRMCRLVFAMPEIDRERIVYLGSSQGGGFGVFLTALLPEIRAAFCGVPAYCDCGGFLIGRCPSTSSTQKFREYYQTMRYFDPANFAPMIKVPVLMSCGFIDLACSPSSVYAAYNSLGGHKMIFNKIRNGHGDAPEEYTPLFWFWTGCHMGLFK